MAKISTDRKKVIETIVRAIQEKKGEKVISLDLRDITESICDYFIICQGDVSPHVKAIAEEVEHLVKKTHKENAFHKEGYENLEWVVLDYFDIIVHVFNKEKREFFNLEGLWSDAKLTIYEG